MFVIQETIPVEAAAHFYDRLGAGHDVAEFYDSYFVTPSPAYRHYPTGLYAGTLTVARQRQLPRLIVSHYTTSKHGLVGLTKNIAYIYTTKGIRCNAICPGGVERISGLAGNRTNSATNVWRLALRPCRGRQSHGRPRRSPWRWSPTMAVS